MDSSAAILLLSVFCLASIRHVNPLYFRLPPPFPAFNLEDDSIPQEQEAAEKSTVNQSEVQQDANQEWNYINFEAWKTYKSCGGRHQSPINIDSSTAVPRNLSAISFGNYEDIDQPMIITNNGHTILLHLPDGYPQEKLPYIENGGLDSQYNFIQLHFHWGSDASQGSEHQINNRTYPAEIHVVHYNKKYPDFSEASHHADGLAVLGIMVELGPEDNPHWTPMLDMFRYIIEDGAEVALNARVLLKELLPHTTSSFYRYFGSLTTPGCQEIVTWTIFHTPVVISESQILEFRQLSTLSTGGHLINNHRPVHQLADRVVYYRRAH